MSSCIVYNYVLVGVYAFPRLGHGWTVTRYTVVEWPEQPGPMQFEISTEILASGLAATADEAVDAARIAAQGVA